MNATHTQYFTREQSGAGFVAIDCAYCFHRFTARFEPDPDISHPDIITRERGYFLADFRNDIAEHHECDANPNQRFSDAEAW